MRIVDNRGKKRQEEASNFDANNFLLKYQGEEVVQDESKWNTAAPWFHMKLLKRPTFIWSMQKKRKKKYIVWTTRIINLKQDLLSFV